MMKKILAGLLMLALLVPMAAMAEEDSLQTVMEKGALVVGFDPNSTPLAFLEEDGDYAGFDIELAYAVTDLLGVELTLSPIDWTEKRKALEDGTVDCLWGVAKTPLTEAYCNFTFAYLSDEQSFVVKTDATYQSQADLAGVKLGVREASASIEALDADAAFRDGLASVTNYKTNEELLAAVTAGEIDVALIDTLGAGYLMTSEDELRVLEEPLVEYLLAVGFQMEDDTLRAAVDNALLELAFNGPMAEMSTEWFTSDITTVVEQAAIAEEH